jgi:hypothetical protein
MHLIKSSCYIIIKNKYELKEAKKCDLCLNIIMEDNNIIYIWTKKNGDWFLNKYVVFGEDTNIDMETTGYKSYLDFYAYCGKEEVEKMKQILPIINKWESEEQMHYFNFDHIGEKIYKDIYVFDANSSFTYGVTKLPKGFELLKKYMLSLYDLKEKSTNKITRQKYKNLQNYLIGYFTKIKEFVSVRSEIINASNNNIRTKMSEIIYNGGKCYISNTDSIVTDSIGNDIMQKYIGNKVGQFKLEKKSDRLYYESANIYQIGDKVKYSGVGYFARKHVDFFKDLNARQEGNLIIGNNFYFNLESDEYTKLCSVEYGVIKVTIFNKLVEKINILKYKISEV